MHTMTTKPKGSTNAQGVRWHCFHQRRNLIVKPAGPDFGNLFQKKWSKLEPIGKLFIPGRKFTVPDAAATRDIYLTTAHRRLDYAIVLIPRR
jgi:hypothetical protein